MCYWRLNYDNILQSEGRSEMSYSYLVWENDSKTEKNSMTYMIDNTIVTALM